jgi:hypothetical protein
VVVRPRGSQKINLEIISGAILESLFLHSTPASLHSLLIPLFRIKGSILTVNLSSVLRYLFYIAIEVRHFPERHD